MPKMLPDYKPTLHLDELAPAEVPFAVRVIQTEVNDYQVQYMVSAGCIWIHYGSIVHAKEVAERIADRLMHPFVPKVIKMWECGHLDGRK